MDVLVREAPLKETEWDRRASGWARGRKCLDRQGNGDPLRRGHRTGTPQDEAYALVQVERGECTRGC